MNLHELITNDMFLPDMAARDKLSAIHELCVFLRNRNSLSEATAQKIESAIIEREETGSTGIGQGVAIPHTKRCPHVTRHHGVLGVSREGIPFDSIDREPVHLVFLIVSPENTGEEPHLQIMRKIAYMGRDTTTSRFLMTMNSDKMLSEILKEVDDHFI
jgi:mannitol/fructose-specific phosphotransferase system IIA component (Ntr-type)